MKYFLEVFLVLLVAVTLSQARVPKSPFNTQRSTPNDNPYGLSRIVNGNTASILEFPYQVYVRAYNNVLQSLDDYNIACGGVLISLGWTLTAAQCLTSPAGNIVNNLLWTLLGKFHVIAGSQERGIPGPNGESESREILGVTGAIVNPQYNAIPHAQYNPSLMTNDIGLLRCDPPFTQSETIQPIALPPNGYDIGSKVGEVVVASGFGRTSSTSNAVSDNLRWINLAVISRATCIITFGSTLPTTCFCAQSEDDPSVAGSICQGDAGGPLTAEDAANNFAKFLVGISSFTSPICGPNPQGFTDVNQYRTFITTNTGIP